MSNDWSSRPEGDANHPQNQGPPQDHLSHLRAQHDEPMESYESGGSEFPTWIIWVLLLVGFNGASAVFGWGWYIY